MRREEDDDVVRAVSEGRAHGNEVFFFSLFSRAIRTIDRCLILTSSYAWANFFIPPCSRSNLQFICALFLELEQVISTILLDPVRCFSFFFSGKLFLSLMIDLRRLRVFRPQRSFAACICSDFRALFTTKCSAYRSLIST